MRPGILTKSFQRPTPSHVSSITPRAPRRGDDYVARGRRGRMKIRTSYSPLALFTCQRDDALVDDNDHRGFVTPPRACGILSSPVAKRMKKISYRGYRFPPEIIHQTIWLYLGSPSACATSKICWRNAEWPYPMRRFGAG